MSQQCTARTKNGLRCRNRQRGSLCPVHSPYKRKRVNYRKYLRSPEWRKKRQEFIDAPSTSNDCYCCGRKYQRWFNLHHLTYDRLGHESLNDLRMLCPTCHEQVHKLAKIVKNIAIATHQFRIAKGLPPDPKFRTRLW